MKTKYLSTNESTIFETRADKALKFTVRLLFAVAVVGQLLFVYHIISFYGGTVISGEYEKWNEDLYKGWSEGDIIGNFFLALHIFLAAIITLGGPLQVIPFFRNRFPTFHRWNGRLYILTAFIISIAGLYMVYTRGVIGGNIMAAGNTLNALLIMFFSVKTWRTAIQRDFVAHRRWAVRAFVMVSGVWFFRIGFGIWILINGGSAPGSTAELSGSFDMFLAFAHSILPLAILETYFYIKEKGNAKTRIALATSFVFLSALLGGGIFMASMIFW